MLYNHEAGSRKHSHMTLNSVAVVIHGVAIRFGFQPIDIWWNLVALVNENSLAKKWASLHAKSNPIAQIRSRCRHRFINTLHGHDRLAFLHEFNFFLEGLAPTLSCR